MKITASSSQILKNIQTDLEEQSIYVELGKKDVAGAKGDVATYINLANLAVASGSAVVGYLAYLITQKNHYVHYRYKDDVDIHPKELKFDNLSKLERDEVIKNLQDKFEQLDFIHVTK